VKLDLSGLPQQPARPSGPRIGNVYRKDGGPKGYMLIVSDNGSTFGYVVFGPDGVISGVGTGIAYYFQRRQFLGRVEDFPPIVVEWLRPDAMP
jgi:hypothetical protein